MKKLFPTLVLTLLVATAVLLMGCTAAAPPGNEPVTATDDEAGTVTIIEAAEEVAAESVAEGNAAIHVINADGSGLLSLSDHTLNTFVQGWSPDGQQLLLARDRDGFMGVYLINADGTNLQQLAERGAEAVWSPDGAQIAFTTYGPGENGQRLYVINPDGSGLQQLAHFTTISWPSWSPDSRRLAFSASNDETYEQYSSDIYVIDADGNNLRNLTAHAAEDSGPTWSPDGTQIAFGSNRDGVWDLYLISVDSGELLRLTQTPGLDGRIHWSPDGRQLLFTSNLIEGHHQDAFDVLVVNADGSDLRNLTNHPASDDWPQWSPDGRRIAFTSDRDGDEKVYVMDSAGTNLVRVTSDSGRDWPVFWSPDGQRLAFNRALPLAEQAQLDDVIHHELGMAVHTPKDAEVYFTRWPEEHKRRLSDEVAIVFTYPSPIADWAGGAMIYHLPSVSTVTLDFEGNVKRTDYKSEAGEARLEEVLADTRLMQELQAEVLGRWSQTQGVATPEPLDADEALMQDAALYAEGQGIPLEEAVTRLRLQESIGPLGATLEENEADTFAGLWLQHQPQFRLVIAFTENGEETARPYIEGQPYADYVELRTHTHTFAELVDAQQATMATAAELGLANNSWIDVIANRVIFETGNPDLFRQAFEENGQTIPEVVELIEIDPEALSPTLQGAVEIIEGADGLPIYFPRQAPTNVHMDALLEGQLTLDDMGCLRVEAEGSEELLVIWRYEDALRVTAETIELLNGDGEVIARVGEPISMGGGEGSTMINIPGMPIVDCPGPSWIAGGMDPLDN